MSGEEEKMKDGNIDAKTLGGVLERGRPVAVVDVHEAEDHAEKVIPGSRARAGVS